jgi:hypothetical protein
MKAAGLDYTVEKRPLFTYDTMNHIADKDTISVFLKLMFPVIARPFAQIRKTY